MKSSFSKSTLVILLALMLGIFSLLIIMIPVMLISSLKSDFSFSMLINLFLGIVYIVNYFIVVKKLLSIIKTTESTPFIFSNVKNFRIIGYCLGINSIFEFIMGYKGSQNVGNIQILATNMGAITPTMIVCFISALMCFVIAEIFYKAVTIKEDNDLTI